MTKPTILYIIGQLNRGGAEQQLHELLAHSDFNAIVLSLAHGGYWAGPLREKGIPVIELKREGHLELRRLWQTAQVIRKIQPDLIHIALDGRTALYPRLGMILAGYKNPVLAEQRSHPTYYPGWFRRLMPLLNRRVDAIVSTSYSAHEYLVGHRLATEAQSCVIPSGINTARFHDPALREGDWPWPDEWRGKLIVGTVGHLTEAKSPETFIQTAARVRETHPDVRFALIGSGPLEGDLRQLIDMLGVGDTVWLAGERHDVPRLLQFMDIFMLNSRSEGLPISIIEAMAAGLPCVVTDVGDCGYVVLHEQTGYVVPVGDVAGLARGVIQLADDPALRQQMGQRGRERADQEFDVQVMVRRYAEVYDQMAAKLERRERPVSPQSNPDLPKPRRVLYLVSRFPWLSTTFTANEMAVIASAGVDVSVAPVWKTPAGHTPHELEKPFLSKIVRPNWRSPKTWLMTAKGLARRPQVLGLIARLVPGHLKSPWLPPKLLMAIPKGLYLGQWCVENGIDQIHAHFLTSPTTVAMIAAEVSGVPYSYTAHAFDITSTAPRTVNGSIPLKIKRAAVGVTISNFNYRHLHERWPSIAGANLHVVYNGINTEQFKADGAGQRAHHEGEPWRVLAVSRLEPVKGYDHLIRAIHLLRQRGVNVRLDIVGDGQIRADLQRQVESLGLNEHITLHGAVLQEYLADHYRRADVFAVSSAPIRGTYESLPTVLLEALAVELPTVSTRTTGSPEIIEDGVTGLLVPPADSVKLADAIQWMIEHPDEARAMGQRGREVVLERFNREKNARRVLELWREAQTRPSRSTQVDTDTMRILYLHQHFTTRQGTAGTRSYEFSRLLQKEGHQITMLAGRYDRSGLEHQPGKLVDEHNLHGIRVLALNVFYGQNMSYLRRMVSFGWFMLLAAGVALRQRKADVIFATSTPLTIAVPAMIASKINRKPFVFEVRDLWPEVPIGIGALRQPLLVKVAKWLERVTYRNAAHVVALSPGMKEGVVRAGTSPDKVTVIPNASDLDLFGVPPETGQAFRAQHPEIGDRPLVVYAGAFGAVNDLSYLIRMAAAMRKLDERVAFLLVGRGSEEARLHTLAEDLGVLGTNLWILPSIPRQEMPSVLSAATIATSIFVDNPVMWTNSANKFFDALASGTPVALNYQGWQADVIREAGAGIVLDARDTDCAARQLVEALHNPVWLESAGKAARRLAEEQFAREKLALQLEEVLRAAAAR